MHEILAEIDQQKVVYTESIPFLDWIDKWMEQKTSLRKSTLVTYHSILDKHVRPYFLPLKLKLQDINAQHIQDYYNRKVKEGQLRTV